MISTSGHLISRFPEVRFHRARIFNNPIIGFFKELDLDIDILNQPTKDIYLRYKLYCNDNGFTPMSSGEFSKLVRKEYGLEIKVTTINGKSVRVFRR